MVNSSVICSLYLWHGRRCWWIVCSSWPYTVALVLLFIAHHLSSQYTTLHYTSYTYIYIMHKLRNMFACHVY
jgi:Na+/melibiose symporter-like transporter